MRHACLLVLLATLAPGTATAAWAGNAATLAAVKEHLKDADPQPVRKLLKPEVCEALAQDSKDAAAVCYLAVLHIRHVTEDTSDPEDVLPILDAFLAIGARTVDLHPDEVDAHVALARARRALCRHRLVDDGTIRPAEWHAIADAWLAAGRLPKGESRTIDAFVTLLEGAAAGEEHRVALRTHAETLGRDLLAKHAGHPQAGAGLAEVRFAQARGHFERGEKKDAEAAAREALALVGPLTGPGSAVRSRARSVANRVARFLRSSKIDRKAEFLSRERKTRWHYLAFLLPWGTHWSIEHTKGKDAQTMTTLLRWDEMPSKGWTRVTFRRYKWSTDYTSDDGDVGGDNSRGLLERDRKRDLAWLTKINRQKKLIRGKLNRQIRKTAGYEIRGIDDDLDPWWIRTWYFKSEERARTFLVRVTRFGPDPASDPEIQHILDSIRELPEEE